MIPRLIIVIPCYNEQEVLPITAPQFLAKIKQLSSEGQITEDSRIMFVNDGSRDETWNIIQKLAEQDEHYIGIAQSRNRGHQNAVPLYDTSAQETSFGQLFQRNILPMQFLGKELG